MSRELYFNFIEDFDARMHHDGTHQKYDADIITRRSYLSITGQEDSFKKLIEVREDNKSQRFHQQYFATLSESYENATLRIRFLTTCRHRRQEQRTAGS